MRRFAPLWLAAVLLALAPQPAYADLGFFRWIDRLSGPGPFSGLFADVNFLCIARRPATATDPAKVVAEVDLDCHANREHRLLLVGVQVAALSGTNNLVYAPPQDQNPPDVRAYPVLGTMTYSLHPALDVGGGIGFVRFSGRGFGFSRFALEPQVTLKPLVLFARSKPSPRLLEVLHLRFNVTGILGGIEAEDFGAVSGLSRSAEWLKGFTIIVNVGSLFR